MSLPGCSSCQTLSCLLTHLNQVSSEMLSPPTQPVWNKYFLQTAQRQITFIPLFFVVHCGSHYHLKLYHLCADSSTVRRRRQWQPTPALLPGKSHGWRSLVGCSPWGHRESDTTEQLHLHTLEKEMATHSSVLAWRIPGMGEPGGLPCMGSHRIGHDWSDLAAAATVRRIEKNRMFRKILWERKWQPTTVFLLVKSHGHRSLEGYNP